MAAARASKPAAARDAQPSEAHCDEACAATKATEGRCDAALRALIVELWTEAERTDGAGAAAPTARQASDGAAAATARRASGQATSADSDGDD